MLFCEEDEIGSKDEDEITAIASRNVDGNESDTAEARQGIQDAEADVGVPSAAKVRALSLFQGWCEEDFQGTFSQVSVSN